MPGAIIAASSSAALPARAAADPADPASPSPHPPPRLALTARDRALLDGAEGEAKRVAMEVIVAMAALQGADSLLDITRAHLDCCIHTGPASVLLAERFARAGGRFAVPASLNAISIDRQGWRGHGVAPGRAEAVGRQVAAYLAMGAEPSFTCAPQARAGRLPGQGEHVGWSESNAVVFANSVLGARTHKYPDYLDLCVALAGRAPAVGCHLEAGRVPRLEIAVERFDAVDDAFWPLLGYAVGALAPNAVPLVTGVAHLAPTRDDLKAFCAAFATLSAAAMVHVLGITPEAGTFAAAAGRPVLRLDRARLATAWRTLNAAPGTRVDLVAIGSPHASATELERLAALCAGRQRHEAVTFAVTLGREVLEEVRLAPACAALEAFGARFIADTCWCMLQPPVVPTGPGLVLTNSAKYAHYGAGLTGAAYGFAALEACVEACCTGHIDRAEPAWLA
jgi:hypothetical protein